MQMSLQPAQLKNDRCEDNDEDNYGFREAAPISVLPDLSLKP